MNVRRILTGLLGLTIIATVVLALLALLEGQTRFAINDIVGALLFSGLLAAHLRGWRWSGQALVIIATLMVSMTTPSAAGAASGVYVLTLLGPAVLAAVLLPWYWSAGAFVAAALGNAILRGNQSLLFAPTEMIISAFIVAGIALASLVARSAQRQAEQNADQVRAALTHAEQQTRELAAQSTMLQEQNDQQRQLLDLVATLETPAVTLSEGVLLAPVVGHLDTRRAQALTRRLLSEAANQRARLVVLDISGVSAVDTAVARALIDASRALRLLGCSVTITGISASVASTLTHLGVSLEGIATARSPEDALAEQRTWATVVDRQDGNASYAN
jgi:anti-anti-sigma regulatory factor